MCTGALLVAAAEDESRQGLEGRPVRLLDTNSVDIHETRKQKHDGGKGRHGRGWVGRAIGWMMNGG